MTELFAVEESLSPRLKWIKKHGLRVAFNKRLKTEPEPYEAWTGDKQKAILRQVVEAEGIYGPFYSIGASEDEALFWMAKANSWPLWNEEELTNDDNT